MAPMGKIKQFFKRS